MANFTLSQSVFSRIFSLGFLFFILTQPRLSAQETEVFTIDTIPIVSTRINQSAAATGRNVTVLTAEEIRRLPANSVDELLRYLPGVEVQTRGAFGAQADISVRGSTFNQVLVLVDNVRLNDPLTGHFNGYIPVALAEIDRIEVLRGPAAALYGPDAVGGVIHILTKTFSPSLTQAKSHTRGELMAGQYNLVKGQAGAFINSGKLSVGTGVLINQSTGQPLPTGLRGDFSILTASGSAGFKWGKGWSAALRTGYDLRTFNAQYFYTRSAADSSREQTSIWWNQGRVAHVGKKHRTEIDFAYKVSQDSFLFRPAGAANIHTTRLGIVQLHHIWQATSRWSFATGGQADQRSIVSSDRGDHQVFHFGVYAISAYQHKGLTANASLRLDQDENYGTELTPQLNISYQAGEVVLRGAAGRAIRAADFTERFVSNNLPGPLSGGRNLGNPFLEAERSWTYEAGADWQISSSFIPSVTFFLRDSRNLIDYVTTPASEIPNNGNLTPGASYFYTQNLAEVNVAGIETAIRFRANAGKVGRLSGMAGYTFLNTSAPDGVVSKYVSSHARHLFTLQSAFTGKNWSVGVQSLYKARDADAVAAINAELKPDYMVWHLQASWFLLDGKLGLQGQVLNLFDVVHQDILGAQLPGRWGLGGIVWNFSQP
jgi:iron complex outermembrane receptor protein